MFFAELKRQFGLHGRSRALVMGWGLTKTVLGLCHPFA